MRYSFSYPQQQNCKGNDALTKRNSAINSNQNHYKECTNKTDWELRDFGKDSERIIESMTTISSLISSISGSIDKWEKLDKETKEILDLESDSDPGTFEFQQNYR